MIFRPRAQRDLVYHLFLARVGSRWSAEIAAESNRSTSRGSTGQAGSAAISLCYIAAARVEVRA